MRFATSTVARRHAVLGITLLLALAACGAAGVRRPATYVDPTPGPEVTHPPRFDESDPAARAFGKLIARKDLTFHVKETVAATGGGVTSTIALDVAGSDFAARVTTPNVPNVELRHVGGVTFARIGKAKWKAGIADQRILEDLADPWLFLCWLDDLEYTGPAADVADGLAFTCRKPFTYQSALMRITGDVGTIESLALVLTADGAPVRIQMSGSGPTLATSSATFTATYEFSKVDERIVVKVPKT